MLGTEAGNYRQVNDLLAVVGFVSYDAAVTDEEFWKRVGEELQRRRLQLGMKSAHAVQTANGPNYKTVAAIEAGNVGEIGSLNQYLSAVKISLVDLFRAVLKIEGEQHTPELEFVIRQFKTSGIDGRDAFLATARLAQRRLAERSTESPHVRSDPTREKPREGNATAKRRGMK